jgi:hypothetical protein
VQRAAILRRRGDLAAAEAQLVPGGPDESDDEELALIRAAQGRDAEAEAIFRRLADEARGKGNVLLRCHSEVTLAEFLAVHEGAEEAARIAADVGAFLEGRGAGLLERRLAGVESLAQAPVIRCAVVSDSCR